MMGDIARDKNDKNPSLGMKVTFMWGVDTMHLVGVVYGICIVSRQHIASFLLLNE